ncbi:MAG: ATP-binding cassette domain-containing protein, partial [Deltaproteobacteria bacterium]
MIEIGDLTYRYGKRAALRGVSLRIEEGEIFGFLGPNGSGKTTLFRVLSTLLSLQEGHVQIEGFDLRSEFRQIRRTIGVVFQYPSLDLKLTARENLIHQGHLYGLFGKTLHTRITTLLERFSLTERAGERVETFSGGMRRRLEIAKGLLHTPRILILDEPSTGLDPGARFDLWA